MIDEGYVKFDCTWTRGPAPEDIGELVSVRNRLHALGLVGQYLPSRIGYGNVSQRLDGSGRFVISGTATGGIAMASAGHFCTVTDWDIAANSVHCTGPVAASSESLTHAMLYACSPGIRSILHVHHRGFWEKLLGYAPTTRGDVAYGTPAMALEMERLLSETAFAPLQIMAMRGHEEGIIAFGPDLASTMEKLETEYFGKMSGGP